MESRIVLDMGHSIEAMPLIADGSRQKPRFQCFSARKSLNCTVERLVVDEKLRFVPQKLSIKRLVISQLRYSLQNSVQFKHEQEWFRDWKSPGAVIAVLVLSCSMTSPCLALEVSRDTQEDIKVCEFIKHDSPCEAHVDNRAKDNQAKIAPAVSTAMGSPKIIHTVGPVVVPQSVTSVVHPVVVASSSRILTRIFQHFGGGGIAGAIGAALVYPLDTIKTRMQAQSKKDGQQTQYENEIDCFRKLIADEGLGSLYSGLVPQLVGIAPEKAIKLTVNEVLLELLEQVMPGAGIWLLELIAGSGGGFSQVVFTNPMEIIKVRLQTQNNQSSKKKGIREIFRELGVSGLYYGAGVTLARDVPSSGIFFAFYAVLMQLYPDQSFADSFLAAIPATILSNPMDVVKTRLQMELPEGEIPHENALSCLRSVWETEGPRALFKGSLARVLRTSPQFGITFLVYNFICGGS